MSAHPNSSRRPPKYCLHKATGQAVVRLAGRDIYLGKFGSDASDEKYAELIARWNSQQPWDEVTSSPKLGPNLRLGILLSWLLKKVGRMGKKRQMKELIAMALGQSESKL